ncbi:hypothetical protein SAMN05421771_1886 [Granulicella pectinivorans]|uniref:O-Antigen ligase n=1 Tax=Granulicella pectinivorans TaxID=474950 RepID=A0A1I6M5P8_9BACT|nr:hypothetical protein [Granulicella pectinivorans]SFS10991.1 hypothetical protein SAMN05421771_1886 [Granulicella pectinivorans]
MMNLRRISDKVLYGILVCCIFSFKFVLIGVGESGIRLDDLLILIAALLLFLRGDISRIERSRSFNLYIFFIAVSFLSAIWNTALGRVGGMIATFFIVRLIQYCTFYYLGYLVSERGIRISKMLTWFLIILCVAVPLQMLGLVPVPGAFEGITSRAVGNTNGPYEMAAVAAFLMCYLGYGQKSRIKGVLSTGLVVLSASRITFIGAALSLLQFFIVRTKTRAARVAIVSTLFVMGFVLVAVSSSLTIGSGEEDGSIVGRLSSAVSGFTLDIPIAVYRSAPTYAKSTDYIDGQFAAAIDDATNVEADQSGLQRIFRWMTLIKTTLASYDSIVLGLGPSFGSAAVDGYFVRLFIETGLIGLFAFGCFAWSLLVSRSKSSWAFRQYVFILLTTSCFIDIFVSYKPMLLFWMWHGMLQYKKRVAENEENNGPAQILIEV